MMNCSDTPSQSSLEYLDRYPIILPSFMLTTTDEHAIEDVKHSSSSSLSSRTKFVEEQQKKNPTCTEEESTKLSSRDSNRVQLEEEALLEPLLKRATKPELDEDWHEGWDKVSKKITKGRQSDLQNSDSLLVNSVQSLNASKTGDFRATPLSPARSRSSSEGSISPVVFDSTSPDAPTDVDVICTRGRAFTRHPGNIRFRKLIKKYVHQYRNANRRLDRSIVINSLLEEIHDHQTKQEVRLLKWNKVSVRWEALDESQARDKVGHALRFAFQEQQEGTNVAALRESR